MGIYINLNKRLKYNLLIELNIFNKLKYFLIKKKVV